MSEFRESGNTADHGALLLQIDRADAHRRAGRTKMEMGVAKTENGRVVETAQEARQAEPGPTVFVVLAVSLSAVVFILAVVWFIFFKT